MGRCHRWSIRPPPSVLSNRCTNRLVERTPLFLSSLIFFPNQNQVILSDRCPSRRNLSPSNMSNRSRNEDDPRSTPPDVDTLYSLKVDNLTYRTRAEDLRRCFEKFGPIGDIYIPRDQFSRSSRGYAFIRWGSSRQALCRSMLGLLSTAFPRNAMPKMHWIAWMAPISMDERFAFNLLAMVELQLRTAERKVDESGRWQKTNRRIRWTKGGVWLTYIFLSAEPTRVNDLVYLYSRRYSPARRCCVQCV